MNAPLMRAKVRIASVTPASVTVSPGVEMAPMQTITAYPVCRDGGYPADGSDENGLPNYEVDSPKSRQLGRNAYQG